MRRERLGNAIGPQYRQHRRRTRWRDETMRNDPKNGKMHPDACKTTNPQLKAHVDQIDGLFLHPRQASVTDNYVHIVVPEPHYTLFDSTRNDLPEVIVVNDALLTLQH